MYILYILYIYYIFTTYICIYIYISIHTHTTYIYIHIVYTVVLLLTWVYHARTPEDSHVLLVPQLFFIFGLLWSLWSAALALQSRLKVGYSCPGTSLDWIYDKLRSWNRFAEAEGFQHWQSLRGSSMVLQMLVATVDKPQT